jgi:hypothetical protein
MPATFRAYEPAEAFEGKLLEEVEEYLAPEVTIASGRTASKTSFNSNGVIGHINPVWYLAR